MPAPAMPAVATMPVAPAIRPGFTLFELLVTISLIAMLVAMLLPAVKTVRDQAYSARCQSNLRQIGLGCMGYLGDYDCFPDTSITSAIYWHTLIEPYVEAEGDAANKNAALRNKRGVIRSCPAWRTSKFYALSPGQSVNGSGNDGDWNPGYGMNAGPYLPDPVFGNYTTVAYWGNPYRQATLANVTVMGSRVMVGDSPDWFYSNSGTRDDRQRHRGRCNLLLFDGHAQSSLPADATTAYANPRKL